MVSDDDSGPNEAPMNWILSAFELTDRKNHQVRFLAYEFL